MKPNLTKTNIINCPKIHDKNEEDFGFRRFELNLKTQKYLNQFISFALIWDYIK